MYKEFPLVYIKFWDHAQGPADANKVIPCEVFGVLREQDELQYIVCTWICEENLRDSNTDTFAVLKSAVIDYQELKIKGKKKPS